MRTQTDKNKIHAFMSALGSRVQGDGSVYFAGGATALLFGWRSMTIDIDIKPDPEPAGLFEGLAILKDELDINVELACPDQFIPAVPGWRERCLFIARHEHIQFFHYDPYGQVLAKLQRRHERDLLDVQSFWQAELIQKDRLWKMFVQIEPQLIRFPALDPISFRASVADFCHDNE